MQDTLQALLALQEIDRDIFRVERELERLPAERAVRRVDVDKRRARLADLQTQARTLRTRVKEIEDQTVMQRQRVRKLEHEASSARADVALQVAFQHEVRTLKRDISTAEDEALLLVDKAEGIEAEGGTQKKDLEEEERVFAEYSANVEREIGEAKSRLAAMQTQRKARLSADVPRETLDLYSRLLAAREGQAIAELDGRICQACFMEVPTNLVVRLMRRSELIQCPSCDRILHARS